MSQETFVATERVDDVPLLLQMWEQMGLAPLLDACFPTHGNWQGLSLGQLTIGWLSYIISQSDHRLNRVEDWAASLLHSLPHNLDPALAAADFNDDRLAQVLRYLAVEEQWASFEQQLNAQTLRVYDLAATTMRLDSTTVSSYGQVNEQGLLQFGHSKDHRPAQHYPLCQCTIAFDASLLPGDG